MKKIVLWGGAALALAGILFIIVASMNAYREMMKIQTGTLWHLPTRVYSSAFELAPGVHVARAGLTQRLERLRYREVKKVNLPGQFSSSAGGMVIFLHPFPYPEGARDACRVKLVVREGLIEKVLNPATGRDLSRAFLEPECIATIYDAGFEDREIISLKECPQHLIDALLCVEDRRFYSHPGVDLRAMLRAMMADAFQARVMEGGSTITQQLVKNLFLTHERTISRKVKEAWLSWIMEAAFTKDEILAMYMNEIYLGRSGSAGIHGFGRASRLFFDKDVSRLALHEAALLVGIVRSPNRYSPYTHPKTAMDRRNTVLAVMQEQAKISPEQYRSAAMKPLGVIPFTPGIRQAPYFVDHVMAGIRELYPEDDLLTKGGLHIFTSLDMQVQGVMEEALRAGCAALPKKIQAASVAIRPTTGEILAMVGGRDYRASQYNRAVSMKRNIGSLIKPVIYYTALKNGYTLASMLDDSPLTVTLEDGRTWSPANFDRISHGNVLLADALASSYNQATVRLGISLGLDTVLPESRAALRPSTVPANPSVLLGAVECSPLSVATMYATFAAGGMKAEPWCLKAITGEHDAVIMQARQNPPERLFDAGAVYLVSAALQETIRRGTAQAAREYGVPDGVCGKTGTTDEQRDSWFAAYSKDLAIVTWLGTDDYRATGFTGATGALPIAARAMARLAVPAQQAAPEGVTFCAVDPANGKKASHWTESPVTLPFLGGTEPRETSDEGMPGVWKTLRSFFRFGE